MSTKSAQQKTVTKPLTKPLVKLFPRRETHRTKDALIFGAMSRPPCLTQGRPRGKKWHVECITWY